MIDWCKSPAPGQQLHPCSTFHLGIASFTEDFHNRIAVFGLQDDQVLVEDDYGDYPDFVTLVEVSHGYPATALQWQPATTLSFAWSQKAPTSKLLAMMGNSLCVFEYTSDVPIVPSSFVGRQLSLGGHCLSLKKGEDVSTKPISNAIHLVWRSDYLLGLLHDHEEKLCLYETSLRTKGQLRASASPPSVASSSYNGSNRQRTESEAVALVEDTSAWKQKHRPTPTFTDSEFLDEW